MAALARLTRVAVLVLLGIMASGRAPSAAQGPGTIRGTVYLCQSHAAVPHAHVLLRNLDAAETLRLVTDEHGRFARVGITPGRYLITAQLDAHPAFRRDTASRLARIESDDVLDMTIGLPGTRTIAVDFRGEGPPGPPDQPHPRCDPPLVPPATPTSDRYMIH